MGVSAYDSLMTMSPASNADSAARVDSFGLPEVELGPFRITDVTREALISYTAGCVADPREPSQNLRPTVMFSLHVGGLNLRKNSRFIAALDKADLLVADGSSVAVLTRLAGGSQLNRHPTTDCGWEILQATAGKLGRKVRVALIGGPYGLSRQAANVMNEHDSIEVVFTEHGFHNDWSGVLVALDSAPWDILLVGMGMPHEAVWVADNLALLHGRLVITCGGWFSHIIGKEKRAPKWLRQIGLEWVARLAQQPARRVRVCAKGLVSTLAMIPVAVRECWRHNRSR